MHNLLRKKKFLLYGWPKVWIQNLQITFLLRSPMQIFKWNFLKNRALQQPSYSVWRPNIQKFHLFISLFLSTISWKKKYFQLAKYFDIGIRTANEIFLSTGTVLQSSLRSIYMFCASSQLPKKSMDLNSSSLSSYLKLIFGRWQKIMNCLIITSNHPLDFGFSLTHLLLFAQNNWYY